MVDQFDLDNSLATLGLSRVMCKGFEEEAYGAVLGLIQFRYHADAFRSGWDRACSLAANAGPRGGAMPFTPRKSFFDGLIMSRKVAFGVGTSLKDINNGESLVANPWTLTDPEFTRCVAYVRNDEDPKLSEFEKSIIPENVAAVAKIGGPVAQKAIGQFLSKAAPELVATTGELMEAAAWPLLIAGVLSDVAGLVMDKLIHAQNKKRYQIDGVRREYLTKTGRGSFLFSNVGGPLTS